MTVRSFVPSEFFPTSPRSGNAGGRIFRMQNMILRGEANEPYAEAFSGALDLAEDIPVSNITGTVACTAGDTTVTGTGTTFTTELHIGQFVEVFGGTLATPQPLVIDEITSNTTLRVCRAPTASGSGATCTRLPVIFEINKKRGTLIRGNAIMRDLGTILCVGDGTLRLNGAVLPGTSLVATRTPKIAIFDGTNYTVAELGMDTPTTLAAGNGAAGVKNMQAGPYSIRVVPEHRATRGYNNPSPKAEVTLVAGNQIRITNISAADTAALQDAWGIYGTLFTQGGGINGPWYKVKTVNIGAGAGEIAAAGGAVNYDFEYNDGEISDTLALLSFNNDPPPHAEYIGITGNGIPVWISTDGPGNTSPGPFIAPAKNNNIEAAPASLRVSTSLPDTIVGFTVAQGRIYLLCVNSLQIGVATQSQDPRIPPVVVRSYWKSGFKHTYQLIFVDGFLVGITNHGLARSIAEGDEAREEFGFATAVEELVNSVNPGHCLLALDPKNNAVCLFSSGHSLNASGFWTTRVWMYGLRENKWIGDVLLTSTTGDRIVSGVATVNGRLEFLCGGRTNVGTTVVKTYRFDEPAGAGIPYYLAWQFSDWGAEDRPKRVGPHFAVIARQEAGGTAGVYGAEPSDQIPVTALEAGNHATSKSGTINLPATSDVTQGTAIELNIDNMKQFTVRIDGTWDGTGLLDRIDEVVVEASVQGGVR